MEKIADIGSNSTVDMITDITSEYLKKMSSWNLKPPPKLIIENRIFLGACEKVPLTHDFNAVYYI